MALIPAVVTDGLCGPTFRPEAHEEKGSCHVEKYPVLPHAVMEILWLL